ncbi:tetratricopeptide repeat protein [Maribacter sp. MAR_2009_72]|uniref:tetratricopeptide repeat protein n=1 Tax=Maribacter sp. MAR_2009_72 TaxID=1250050 RepID=UPI0016448FA2|nr:tetratricopeptide repeat protein [Maribacter sp. MAR_2009_72]
MERENLLEKYLRDKLTETEWQTFDALLKSDPDFKEEVEFHTGVKRAVTAEEDENFRNILSDFESEYRNTVPKTVPLQPSKRVKLPMKWMVAASVTLLAGIAYFFSANQAADPQDLFVANFKPYRNVTHPITRGEETTDAKTKAFLAYSKGDYKEAIPLFDELYASDKEAYYLFYMANALIQLNRAGEAIPLLQEHLKTQDALTNKSNWYLAMAYLQLRDTKKAGEALKKVLAAKGYKAEEARQLLDAL